MAQTEELIAEGKMTERSSGNAFISNRSSLRKKFGWNADAECLLNETLKREQPFVMSVPASEGRSVLSGR